MSQQLHLVTDPRFEREVLLRAVRAAAENGVDWVHVRDHAATAADLFELTQRVVAICRPRGVRVVVNDRVDVALAAMADAVQFGARGLPLADVQRLAPELELGVSVHDLDAARAADAAGATWLTFGHVFPTPSHPDEPARGLGALTRIVQETRAPVIAIGGIGVEQVPAVLRAGSAGIAVIAAILACSDPAAATRSLRAALNRLG